MKEEIRALVVDKFGLSTDLADNEPLFSTGLLDSLSAVTLLAYLADDLNVHLSPLDVGLDDVDSIDAINATVLRFK